MFPAFILEAGQRLLHVLDQSRTHAPQLFSCPLQPIKAAPQRVLFFSLVTQSLLCHTCATYLTKYRVYCVSQQDVVKPLEPNTDRRQRYP